MQVQALAHAALQRHKAVHTQSLQQFFERFAGARPDNVVHIQKGIIQSLSQRLAHRAFARSGHSDQNNIFHEWFLTVR